MESGNIIAMHPSSRTGLD